MIGLLSGSAYEYRLHTRLWRKFLRAFLTIELVTKLEVCVKDWAQDTA